MKGPSGVFRRFVAVAAAVFRALLRHEALVDAGAMAFSLFLASIPLMGLFGTIVAHGLRGEPQALVMVSSLVDLAPAEVKTLVDRQLWRGSNHALAPVFLLGSLWIAAIAFHDAMTVFEGSLGAVRRSWLHKRLLALGCVVALLALLSAFGVAMVLVSGGIVALLSTAENGAQTRVVLVPILAIVATWLLVAGFFRIAVRHRVRPATIWPGASATIAIGTVVSYAFATYARTLASYAVFYGSLAAVAVFMIWLWLCCVALLVGVEVNSYLERGGSFDSVPPPSARRE
jgi:membrane protein